MASERAILFVYTDRATQLKVEQVAEEYDVSVSQLLAAFARHADTLVWFLDVAEQEKESPQLAG